MESEWPPLKSCMQYRQGILAPFLQKFDWEADEDDLTQYEYSEDSDDENAVPRKRAFKISSLKKFVEEVRTTRGYDVDTRVPRFMCSPFIWIFKKGKTGLGLYEKWVNIAIELAITHINSKTGKFHKHVDTLKVVDTHHNIMLLTFTAGELIGLRFTKRMKDNPEEWEKKVAAAAVDAEQTFLAAVSAQAPCAEKFKLLECFLKPQGPAPWEYVEPFECYRGT